MATTRKKTASKKAVAKRGSTAVATRDDLAKEAAAMQERIGAPASNTISIRDKVFTLPDGTIINGAMDVVIVDFINWNKMYDGAWDPKNPQPPVCWAFDKVYKTLAPSDNVLERQAPKGEDCSSCPMNQFGSDGDGKACKNTRLLAVLPADAEADDPIMTLSVPPTAIKGFDAYVAQVAKLFQLPPIGVVTTIDFHPEKSYPMPLFGNPQVNENLDAFLARRPEAEVLLTAEPDTAGYEPKKKKAGRGRGRSRS